MSDIIRKKFSRIYYIYPYELETPPVDWDERFPDITVEFLTDIPDLQFFDSVENGALVG